MINVSKLTRELELAGIPVHGCTSAGRIDFKAEATPDERAQAFAIRDAHDPDTLLPEEQAIQSDFAALKSDKLRDVLARIEADLTALENAPTNAQVVQAIRRILQGQRDMVKMLAHLADRE